MMAIGKQLLVAMRMASIEIRLGLLAQTLERSYRADQPRAPRGTPIGGQWIDDAVHVAAGPRCDGFASGCQNGGSFGTSGIIRIEGKKLCWDCAIKYLGLQNDSAEQQLKSIRDFDSSFRK